MRRSLFDWRRALIAAPALVAVAVATYLFVPRDGGGVTPHAALADTRGAAAKEVGVHEGETARDFIGQSPDGKPLRLSDLRGKPTVINFWATWCSSCLAELPDLKSVQDELGADAINVVAVNAGEDSAAAKRFLKVLDAPAFHVGMDPTLVVSDAYGVLGLPQSVFIDADGVIRAVYTGQLSRDLMQQYVRAASTGIDVPDAPHKLRLITTVAREHTLDVRRIADDGVDLRSKSLRCDDSYCATVAIDAIGASDGVHGIDRHLSEDPPRIVVTFDPSRVTADDLATKLAGALTDLHDPLYERPLEIVHE